MALEPHHWEEGGHELCNVHIDEASTNELCFELSDRITAPMVGHFIEVAPQGAMRRYCQHDIPTRSEPLTQVPQDGDIIVQVLDHVECPDQIKRLFWSVLQDVGPYQAASKSATRKCEPFLMQIDSDQTRQRQNPL